MFRIENILAIVFTLVLGLFMSFPALASADASVNGFFPKDYVLIAKKEKRNVYKTLVKKSDFSYNQEKSIKQDTFSIPKNFKVLRKD